MDQMNLPGCGSINGILDIQKSAYLIG